MTSSSLARLDRPFPSNDSFQADEDRGPPQQPTPEGGQQQHFPAASQQQLYTSSKHNPSSQQIDGDNDKFTRSSTLDNMDAQAVAR